MLHRHADRRLAPTTALVLTALALSLSHAPLAQAHERRVEPDRRAFASWHEGRLVDVQVRIEGEASPMLIAPGREDRRYVQAFAGRRYEIVLRNTTDRRVAVVLSVDGLNVLSGERSTLDADDSKYVLAPYETATIPGWRTSLDEVRQFTFVDERRSYAERSGQANADMGWIRIASFREFRPWSESRRERNHSFFGSPAPVGEAAPPSAKGSPAPLARGEESSVPGTGWGERREDHVRQTWFIVDGDAVDHLAVRYEYASGLQALGVLPSSPRWRDRLAERDQGFARPPRW